MAGKFRRKFIDIISDTVTEHYSGKVSDMDLAKILADIRVQIGRLEQCRLTTNAQRSESLKKLRKLPLEKLNELLMENA